MPLIEITAVTSRTATILLNPDDALYELQLTAFWTLRSAGNTIASGSSKTVPLVLEGLKPSTKYELTTLGRTVTFVTKPCAGMVDITFFGADTSDADNSIAIARAIEAVPEGGTLYIPSGSFQTGPIFLKSNITVLIAKGAELRAIPDRENWPILPTYDELGRIVGTWEGLPEASFASFITAIGCENLTLTGSGIIDGGGDRGDWWSWAKETREGARRPRLLFLAHCTNVVLSGITVRNSPSWTIHPFHCHQLLATGVKIQNPPDSPNTDGFNPESTTDCRLAGLHISVGDDCIAVKSGKRAADKDDHLAPTRNLLVENCLMERGHGAVVLGSEMSGDITEVTIRRCSFIGTDRGLRIKTRRGRGGKVAHVRLSEVEMDKVQTPLAINAFYFCDPDGCADWVQSRLEAPVDHTTPSVMDISMEYVTARNVSHAAVAALGLPEAPITDVRLNDVIVSFDPAASPAPPLMAANIPPVRHAQILAEFAEINGNVAVFEPHKEAPQC